MFELRAILKGVAVAVVLAGAGAALAAGPIEERQQLMKMNGKAIGVLAKILKGEEKFDPNAVKENAQTIISDIQKFVTLFPEDNKQGPPETYAKAEIWTDKDGFNAAADNAIKAAQKVAAATDEASFKAAMPDLGNACGACHKKYRRPKD
jgi:cytochrome c556